MSRTRHHAKRYWKGKKSKFWNHSGWCNNEPKSWRNLMKHKKRRAEWARIYHGIRKGADLDNVVYPLDTKPWEYYW